MVLDTVEQITENNQSPGYEIGDHKLVFKNTYDNEDNGQPKKYTMNANDENAPDTFYYVHIDVDLDRIKDCEESESDSSNIEELNNNERNQIETTYEGNYVNIGFKRLKTSNHTPYTKCKVIEYDALTQKRHEFVGVRYRNKLGTSGTVIWV